MPKFSEPHELFDRAALRRFRNRAAPAFSRYDFLLARAGESLLDRLQDIRKTYPRAAILGAGAPAGLYRRFIEQGGIERAIVIDPAERMLPGAPDPALRVCAEADFFPCAHESLDLILGLPLLHATGDLPGALAQFRRALKPDGLFLCAMFGGATLWELRQCLMQAETTLKGGVSPRVFPFADKQQLAALLHRAGFALPVTDSERVTVTYDHPLKLLADLRGMGESNAVAARGRSFTARKIFTEACRIYQEEFSGPDGRITATFETLFAIGWSPAASQQKPLRPGSAQHSLAEALSTTEIGTGVATGRAE